MTTARDHDNRTTWGRGGALSALAAQPLPREELGYDHAPRVGYQLGHVPVVEPRKMTAHPLEAQVGRAGQEEEVRLAGDERVTFLSGVGEAHRCLIAGERDVHNGTDPEL